MSLLKSIKVFFTRSETLDALASKPNKMKMKIEDPEGTFKQFQSKVDSNGSGSCK